MPTFDLQAFFDLFRYDKELPLLFERGFFVFFFALFMICYYRFRNNFSARRYIFCFFSLYFFYKASGQFVAIVIISAIVDFLISNAIWRQQNKLKRKLLLICSIVFNIGLLVYFKYTDFFISLSNDFLKTGFDPLELAVPVGISFFTFENVSYTIDVYRGQFEPAKKFSDYLLFLSFFPKLVMGPIVRAHDFVPQINQPYALTEKDFSKGFYLIISGLVKKLIISDFITVNFVNYIFDDPGRYTGLENLFAVYAYAIVIYCDFSGYSDIAIGIARWLGFTIPTNFLSPYQSKSITEFWRRWHISLSSWLRDYLYIPLGGNRSSSAGTWIFATLFFAGVFFSAHNLFELTYVQSAAVSSGILLLFILPAIITRESKGVAANMNLLTTMLLGGFWHGASWNFIIWGALHGISLAVHKLWMLLTGKRFSSFNNKPLYNVVAALITFHFVCFCWIFFHARDMDTAMTMIHQISTDFSVSVWGPFATNYYPVLIMMGIGYIIHLIPDGYADQLIERFQRVPLVVYMVIFFAFLILYGYFKSAEPVMPIYLQF